jgi:hypothetical protein
MTDSAIGDITEEAHEIVTETRDSHGDAYENHRQIADLWSAFLGVDIRAHQAAIMMTMVKASRMQAGTLDKDHFRDIAGYADVAWDCAVRDPDVEVDDAR